MPKPDVRVFSIGDRLLLSVASRTVAGLIALIGRTLRFEVLVEDGAAPAPLPADGIYCLWHQAAFSAAWYFRHYNACVLISRSFDGELIARTLARLGFRSVRGSSSRAPVAGLLALRAEIEDGGLGIFMADGPRGPRFQSKPGPVKLAQATGRPIGCLHLEPARKWSFRSWDLFQVPKPFSRVAVSWARSVPAPPASAGTAELEQTRQALDAALERARAQAVRWAAREAEA